MADVELWLTRDAALERLRRFLKLSVGAAEAAFDEAMLSGTIRSRAFAILLSEVNMERLVFEDRLEPEAWKRGDPRSINGKVSSDDLEFWVAQQLALSPDVAKPPEAAALLPDTGEAHDVTTPSGVQTNRQAALKAKCIAWIRTLPEQPLRRKPDVRVDALAGICHRDKTVTTPFVRSEISRADSCSARRRFTASTARAEGERKMSARVHCGECGAPLSDGPSIPLAPRPATRS